MLSEYRHRRRVQFYETDAAGIVHFSWFFRYMEEAEHALWREAGLSIAPAGSEIGWARVSASCEYFQPLRFEDEFEVAIRITAITGKTMTYECVLWLGETKVAAATMTVICVRISPGGSMKAAEMPAEIAARFGVAPREAAR